MSVNKPKRGRPNADDEKLSREAILEAALTWMREEKRQVTIRGLARRLEVDPMAIYHYFDSKAALLEAITVAIMEDLYMPQPNADWQHELQSLCHSYLTQLGTYRGLLETLLSMGKRKESPAAVFAERFYMATATLRLSTELQQPALNLLVDYLHGFALAMQHEPTDQKPSLDDTNQPLALFLIFLENAVFSSDL